MQSGIDLTTLFLHSLASSPTVAQPWLAGWLDRKLHGKGSLEADTEYALCLNLADVQQMQLRLLQGRLTWLALSAGFDQDHGVSEGVLTQLGPTLRDYGGVFTFHSTIS